jgi:glycosyltransferase involved in cell wall biosynthesis
MSTLRKVLVGTPALDGKVDCWYADSLFDSIKIGLYQGIDIIPSILHNESILPMARNELLKMAYENNMESIVFIDDDERWHPQALVDVINSPYEVFGLPVVSKTDNYGAYNIKLHDAQDPVHDSNGNLKVDGIGTGFLKIGRKALEALWDSSRDLHFRGKDIKMICEYGEIGTDFVSEDYNLCRKLRELGFEIWINPQQTVSHTGTKTWHGDFYEFLGRLTTG